MADRKEVVLEKLERVRASLLDLVGTIEDEQWERKVFSEEEAWRVSDLLRHVVSAEHSMTRLIENIRDGGEGASPDFDLMRWNASRVQKAIQKSVSDLTADLAKNRTYLLGVIQNLSEDDLDKKGRHGSMRIMSIEEILHLIADHEEHHMGDIQQAIS
ncbi:MAG: DinB family protein [Candidatus Promineifilaceae bacterium]